MIPTQIGAFFGYISFGLIADKIGRRLTFAFYVATAAALTPVYAHLRSETALLAMGPMIGFFGTGFFSLFGAMLSELYPTVVRAAGQSFCYNAGRALSSLAPYVVGSLADHFGVGASLALNSAFFLLGAILIWTLPETGGVELGEYRKIEV